MLELRDILMTRGAYKIVSQCADVKPKEKALVVCDHLSYKVAYEVARVCTAIGAETNIVIMEPRSGHGEEPTVAVSAAMEKADVIFAVTSKSMSHSQATKNALEIGARVITMPEFKPDMLIAGAIEADFLKQKPIVEKVARLLADGRKAYIWSEQGSNMALVLEGRQGRSLTGIACNPSTYAAPPNIEASIAPVEGTAEGTLIINGAVAGLGLISCPICLEIQAGKVVTITSTGNGTEASWLASELACCNDELVYMIGELGIGLNPKAKLCGTILEDEGVLGSIHVALGSNINFGGKIKAARHIDLVMVGSCLDIDGETIICNGKLNI